MATHYVSVGDLTAPLTIPDSTWTLVTGYKDVFFDYEATASGTAGMAAGLINLADTGFYHWGVNLRWADTGPDFGASGSVRFVRDPLGTPDQTGHTDYVFNNGRTWVSHTWFNKLDAGLDVGVEVYQSTGADLVLEYAQFKMLLTSHF